MTVQSLPRGVTALSPSIRLQAVSRIQDSGSRSTQGHLYISIEAAWSYRLKLSHMGGGGDRGESGAVSIHPPSNGYRHLPLNPKMDNPNSWMIWSPMEFTFLFLVCLSACLIRNSIYSKESTRHKACLMKYGGFTGVDPGFWSGGASGVLTPRGGLSPNLLKIGVFPLKLPENCMKKSWGQGGPGPQGPPGSATASKQWRVRLLHT